MGAFYELKRFKNSDDNDLTQALTIYSKNIDPLIRTDTREIIYWLDNYNKTFVDKFYLLGLYLNEELIGYSQLVFFAEEKMVFVDYIVIDNLHRRNNTFYEFIEHIKSFFEYEGLIYDQLICEVGYYDNGKELSGPGRTLIRLLKMSGFGVIKNDYTQPMLGKTNFESQLNCVLMIFPVNELNKIKKETFQIILNTIYFKHYKRWYDPFFNELEQASYAERLLKLKSEIESPIKKKDFIEINGYGHLFPRETQKPGSFKYVQIVKFIGIIILLSIFAVSIGAIHYLVKTKFKIDLAAQTYIITASAVGVFALLTFIYNDKKNSVFKLIEKLIDKFTK